MLKIDLLPRQIAIARNNKILVALIIVLLLAEVAALASCSWASRAGRTLSPRNWKT
ncbi:MAG: hypothetical protein GF393_10920 [Armatimonadia bacterium]|nr:hypothetical protein [Armatimonadia bacterium]